MNDPRTSDASTELVLVSTADAITEIRLNRPAKKNALTQAMYVTIVDALAAAEADPAVRCILLTGYTPDEAGAPGAVFTAGNDIADFISDFNMDAGSPVFRFLFALVRAKKPIVAAVNGVAVGVGTTMLLHCDMVFCGRSARFQLPFINLALVPEAGSSLLLPRLVGQRRAAELLMLGDPFDATTAEALGIVNHMVEDADVLPRARAAALALAAKAPGALATTKELLRAPIRPQLEEVLMTEARAFAAGLQSEEAIAALQAFLARRK